MTKAQIQVDLDTTQVTTHVEKFPRKGGTPNYTTYHYFLRFGSFELELVSNDLDVIEQTFQQAEKDVACLRSQQQQRAAS